MERTATCACGALSLTATGEPIKVSGCHCRSCRKRTGSAFSVAVFFAVENTRRSGSSHTFTRTGDSGLSVEFHFCPACASSVFWYPEFRSGWVAVAIGCFDDRTLVPTQAVYAEEHLAWAEMHCAGR